ncbi:hydrogen peroxide-dependent heme synthase [Corynebacterium aquatimens]|uniref:Coproheme decarboxylase n=1 Tax=Corynebacterium aquatimens TaxID=1190508 RepID=A0A931E3C2_9CORY|nr:hydrogen peroxide-dependent heme synthase [Corynebacterium aquatimens]MBG6121743.1 chlorite dismutase [Corynebacterium aquatimens]WJY65718.1 putative heme peroxidase [Corynebacterium aquatimens]
MAQQVDLERLNNTQRYAQWATFRAIPGALPDDRADVIAQAREFFSTLENDGEVVVRGLYDISGIRAEADVMIWWHAEYFEQIQEAYNAFRRDTLLGQALEVFWIGVGLHRPAEFNRGHLPSFIMGEEPQDWITVYPFTRSYDWYLLDPAKRRDLLIEHGKAAAEYADVRANTMSAFSLGDYEWMLAFEAPTLERISDLMHKMRYTEARLHVREELPFFSGRRVDDVSEIVELLP